MTFLLLIPTIISFLCLGAHFMHHDGGNMFLAGTSALMPVLLLIRTRFMLRAFQALLLLASVEWLLTLPELMNIKRAMGEPYMIDVYILGGVALFNIFAALLFQTRRLRSHYPKPGTAMPTA